MLKSDCSRPGRWLVVMAMTAIGAPGMAGPMAAHPALAAALNPSCGDHAETAMPDLGRLYLRSDPQLHTSGRAIKGLYYATRADGPNQMVAFALACAGRLDPRPFLLFEFDSGAYLLDTDGDGCADGAGVLARGEIDPMEFLPALRATRRSCVLRAGERAAPAGLGG